jgi:hypothetical protein
MAGVLGFGADLLGWTDDQLDRGAELVELYSRTAVEVSAAEARSVGVVVPFASATDTDVLNFDPIA